MDVAVAHFMGNRAGEDRPITAATIHDNFVAGVGEFSLEIAFENAFAEVNRLNRMTGEPLGIFANVDKSGPGIGREPGAGLFEREFLDVGACFVDEFQETGRMVHRLKTRPLRGRVNGNRPGGGILVT
jgi:hypothetical protein